MLPARNVLTLTAVGGLAALLSVPADLGAQDRFAPPPHPVYTQVRGAKDPAVARVMGIVPGLGHVYAGEPRRAALVAGAFVGITLFGVAAVVGDCAADYTNSECGSSALVDVVVPAAMIGTVGFSIWDAGRAAHRTNSRGAYPARLTMGRSAADGAFRIGIRLGN